MNRTNELSIAGLYWTTDDGQQIPLRDLTKDHLDNIIQTFKELWAQARDRMMTAIDGTFNEARDEILYSESIIRIMEREKARRRTRVANCHRHRAGINTNENYEAQDY